MTTQIYIRPKIPEGTVHEYRLYRCVSGPREHRTCSHAERGMGCVIGVDLDNGGACVIPHQPKCLFDDRLIKVEEIL
jgi:hypothetical protein